jgi:hypothetical protein
MARLLNLGQEGFLGCLFNMIFRDAFHDYSGSHTTNFTTHNGGAGSNKSFDNAYFTGGSKDSIQFSETVIKTLAALIKKCRVKEEEEEGKAENGMEEEGKAYEEDCADIDRVELLKAYNDIIIDLKANGVMSYFELDFIDGKNKDIVRESPFYQWYYDHYGKQDKKKYDHERNIDYLHNMIENPDTEDTLNKLRDNRWTPQKLPELLKDNIKELNEITEILESIQKPKIYESPGGLLINLHILTKKKEANALTHDEFIMLFLLTKQLNINKDAVIEKYRGRGTIEEIKQRGVDGINDFNFIDETLNNFDYNVYTTGLEEYFTNELINLDMIYPKSMGKRGHDNGVGDGTGTPQRKLFRPDGSQDGSQVARNLDKEMMTIGGNSSSFNINHYHNAGNASTKYNLYTNAIKHVIERKRDLFNNGIQRGGYNAANWHTMFKCFAYNCMGIKHDTDGNTTGTVYAPLFGPQNYHRHINFANYAVPIDDLYNNCEWFDFEKTTAANVPATRINDEVVRYVNDLFKKRVDFFLPLGVVAAPLPNIPALPAAPAAPAALIPPLPNMTNQYRYGYLTNTFIPTIDDLSSIRSSLLPFDPANNYNEIEKYITRNENSINYVKFPVYKKSAINLDLFRVLSSTFHNGLLPLPPGTPLNYDMMYVINNECKALEPAANGIIPNVLTNYLSYCDPGTSGSHPAIIVNEYGAQYFMGVYNGNANNKYELQYTPQTGNHIMRINSTSTQGIGPGAAAAVGTANYMFEHTPTHFGVDRWNQVTKDVCIARACEFVTSYMRRALNSNPSNVIAAWKSIRFFINDFGKLNIGGILTTRCNVPYPRINYQHNAVPAIMTTPMYNTITSGGLPNPMFRRLPVFYLFYSFMLFKGAGDIGQELTTLIKWGGIAPAPAAAGPVPGQGISYISTNQPDPAQKFPAPALGATLSTTDPNYLQFDANGNAPRFLVSADRPSGTRFILMMHYAVKTLLESNDDDLCLRQNNINTLAFGGYVTHLYKSIFAKVNNPLYFGNGAALVAAAAAAAVNSTKAPVNKIPEINRLQPLVYTYGGKKQKSARKKHATKKSRKHHNRTLTKRKHKVTKRKHKVTKRKHKVD